MAAGSWAMGRFFLKKIQISKKYENHGEISKKCEEHGQISKNVREGLKKKTWFLSTFCG